MLRSRFFWHRESYEALAAAIQARSHAESLSGDESRLAHSVKATHPGELDDEDESPRRSAACAEKHDLPSVDARDVVAVHFMLVTRGFGAHTHAGFMRAFDESAERCLRTGHGIDGWSSSKPLADHWYIVGD